MTYSFYGRTFSDLRMIRIFFLLLILHAQLSGLGPVIYTISEISGKVHRMAYLTARNYLYLAL